jgi:acyl-[acyl-carrier-protein] desaturase
MDQVSRGYYPDGQGGSLTNPLDGVVYTTLQELATRISHRNTGRFTRDPLIEKLTARFAVDENLHYIFYRELGKEAVELDPSAMVLAMHRQVTGFAMPGRELPEFREKASQIAKAGIYDLRIHHDDVLLTILFRHRKLDQLTGLTEEAERARDGILRYLGRLDARRRRSTRRGEPPPTSPEGPDGGPRGGQARGDVWEGRQSGARSPG